jgi:hypothetical protein
MNPLIRYLARLVLAEIMQSRGYAPPTVTLTLDKAEAYHIYTLLNEQLDRHPLMDHHRWHTADGIMTRLKAAMEMASEA